LQRAAICHAGQLHRKLQTFTSRIVNFAQQMPFITDFMANNNLARQLQQD